MLQRGEEGAEERFVDPNSKQSFKFDQITMVRYYPSLCTALRNVDSFGVRLADRFRPETYLGR